MTRILPVSILFLAGWFYTQSPQIAQSTTVRVRLFSIQQPSEIRVTTGDGQTVVIDARTAAPMFRNAGPVTIQRASDNAIRLPYPIEVTASKGTLLIVTEIPLEDYVGAVLAGESSNFRSDESLKAIAVASRTYAVHFLKRHKAEGFDFCDTTHCQDFRISAVSDRLRHAVNNTRNDVIRYEEQPIPAYYHQDCGGIPEPQAPYLRQLQDGFCVSRGRMQWSAELTASDLQVALGVHDVSGIEITERSSSGRARRLRINGTKVRVVDAEAFRLAIGRTLGWNKVRSDLYEVRRSGDRFLFEGYGAGHGIGLCQDGAAAMGEQGYTYKEILAYYYPNTRIFR
jgi:stage II sporulation protein D